METFPISAPPFTGDCRVVPAGNAFEWLRQGWTIFVVNPGVWIAMIVVFGVLSLGLSLVPLLGHLAAQLLTPVLVAGTMIACQKAENGEALEVSDLFAGFKRNTGNLVILGVLYMLSMLAFFAILAIFGGGSILLMGIQAGSLALGSLVLAVLLSLTLLLLLSMAIWFAPVLVVLNNMQPIPALLASFNASLKNTVPFLIYGLITLMLFFLAVLPIGLGLLVFGPVLLGSIYASYRDIFVAT